MRLSLILMTSCVAIAAPATLATTTPVANEKFRRHRRLDGHKMDTKPIVIPFPSTSRHVPHPENGSFASGVVLHMEGRVATPLSRHGEIGDWCTSNVQTMKQLFQNYGTKPLTKISAIGGPRGLAVLPVCLVAVKAFSKTCPAAEPARYSQACTRYNL